MKLTLHRMTMKERRKVQYLGQKYIKKFFGDQFKSLTLKRKTLLTT